VSRITTSLLLSAVLAAGLGGCGSGGQSTSVSTATSRASTTRPPRPETAGNPIFTRAYPKAPGAEQTDPAVTPASGTTTSVFTLHLTAREPAGPSGAVRHTYLILMRGPHPRCSVFTQLTMARKGTRVGVALRPPIELGWCRGAFRGEVVLQASPNCVPASPGSATVHCPQFASRLADVGHFRFATR
jgi:hypothetical protein